VYLTREGLVKIENELREYEQVKRPIAARDVEEARKQGDLTENAEYDAAREELDRLDARIAKLRHTLSKVQIIESNRIDSEKVNILNKVRLRDLDKGLEFTYILVSPEEVDIDRGLISIKSPVGRAILGKKVGEIVEFTVPAGDKRWQIIAISPPEV
jgi:transcription elongation factor GreA